MLLQLKILLDCKTLAEQSKPIANLYQMIIVYLQNTVHCYSTCINTKSTTEYIYISKHIVAFSLYIVHDYFIYCIRYIYTYITSQLAASKYILHTWTLFPYLELIGRSACLYVEKKNVCSDKRF